MTGAPFVVVLAAATVGAGQSTLAENLAVYLKGLAEDLPVALISFDPGQDPAQTFEIAGQQAVEVSKLFAGDGLEARLTLGQFGVEYLVAGVLPDIKPCELRRLLLATRLPGILIIDAGPLMDPAASAALQAADLVLAPVRNAAGLAPLARIRSELKAGGGNDQMFCLIPALIDDCRAQQRQLDLLRFAAAERGCQVLDDEFVRDDRLPQATAGAGGSILTRMPDSPAHRMMKVLAGYTLRKFTLGPDQMCRQERLRIDAVLPRRAKRITLQCPLCQRLAWQDSAHYCESLPQRRRWLLHADCLNALLADRRLQPLWLLAERQSLVLRTGIEGTGLSPQLRLLLAGPSGALLEAEQFLPALESDWQVLVRHATGRTLAEQLPAVIMIYPAITGSQNLSTDWYAACSRLRGRLRAELGPDL